MQSEPSNTVTPTSLGEFLRTRREVKTVPSVHYYCDSCDSEWVWIRHGPLRCPDAGIAPLRATL